MVDYGYILMVPRAKWEIKGQKLSPTLDKALLPMKESVFFTSNKCLEGFLKNQLPTRIFQKMLILKYFELGELYKTAINKINSVRQKAVTLIVF